MFFFAWLVWFVSAQTPVYSVSQIARLELTADIQPIHALAQGVISKVNMSLGQKVSPGQLLFELDIEKHNLQLQSFRKKLQALHEEQQVLDRKIAAISNGSASVYDEFVASLAVTQANIDEANEQESLAKERLERLKQLQNVGNVSELELIEARSQLRQREATAAALKEEFVRVDKSNNVLRSDRDAELQGLLLDQAQLKSEAVELESQILALEYESKHYAITARGAGTLGEIDKLYEGMQLEKGQRIGAIVPEGSLKVDARFTPAEAFGRIKENQRGRIIFDGFPWAQYGSGDVTVKKIGREVRDGLVQVELSFKVPENSAIPLQHGMPVTVEVITEYATPAALVLRAAGKAARRAP